MYESTSPNQASDVQPEGEAFVKRTDRVVQDTFEAMNDKEPLEDRMKKLTGMEITHVSLYLHRVVFETVLQKLKAGTLTPSERSVAREYIASVLKKADEVIARKKVNVDRLYQRTNMTRVLGIGKGAKLYAKRKAQLETAQKNREWIQVVSNALTPPASQAPNAASAKGSLTGLPKGTVAGTLVLGDPVVGAALGALDSFVFGDDDDRE